MSHMLHGTYFYWKLFVTYRRFTCFMWQPKEGSQIQAASVYLCVSHVCKSHLPQTTLRQSVKSVDLGGTMPPINTSLESFLFLNLGQSMILNTVQVILCLF